jgi:hypothetical protein
LIEEDKMTGCKYKDCPNPRAYPNVNMCKKHIAEESKRRYWEAKARTAAKAKTYPKPTERMVVFLKNESPRSGGKIQQMTEVQAMLLNKVRGLKHDHVPNRTGEQDQRERQEGRHPRSSGND